jgi:hypothetical protein
MNYSPRLSSRALIETIPAASCRRAGGLAASFAASLALAAAAPGEITEQDMRDAGLSDEQIQEFQEKVESPDPDPPRLPTAEEYLAGGREQSGRLARRIERDPVDGLEVALQVIHRENAELNIWADRAVLNGLSLRRPMSPAVLSVMEELARVRSPRSPIWEDSRRWWARAFSQAHGHAALDLAEGVLEDGDQSADRRALHLFVLGSVGWQGDSDLRARAIALNRPYLSSPEPELQRAAIAVAAALYDYDARGEIEYVAWNSKDPWARGRARLLVKNFLDFGPDPARRPIVAGRSIRAGGYDPEGLMAYRAERDEWQREQDRLLSLEEDSESSFSTGPSSPGRPSTVPGAHGTQ